MPETLNPQHAVYVGSFDPLTLGHVDIIRRGARLFEKLTVGIGINPDKVPLLTSEERLSLSRECLVDLPNVDVQCFQGLAVDFIHDRGAAVMLRGMRTLTDVEAEFTMTLANRALDPDIETVFLMASEQCSHISSTLIKQIAVMGQGDIRRQLTDFLPQPFIDPVLEKASHFR